MRVFDSLASLYLRLFHSWPSSTESVQPYFWSIAGSYRYQESNRVPLSPLLFILLMESVSGMRNSAKLSRFVDSQAFEMARRASLRTRRISVSLWCFYHTGRRLSQMSSSLSALLQFFPSHPTSPHRQKTFSPPRSRSAQ